MKNNVDFSDLLDLKPRSKKKRPGVDFGVSIDPECTIVVTETVENPNDYKVDCGDLSLYCAAMFGGPLF